MNKLVLCGVISAIILALSTSASSHANVSTMMVQAITSKPNSVRSIASNNTFNSGGIPEQQQQVLSVGPPLNAIFKKAENSVVQITSRLAIPRSVPSGSQPQPPVTALGSGFVSDTQGHVITNSHVVNGAQTADVTFVDGNRFTAKVVGNDVYSDIAVLKILSNSSEQTKQNRMPS